MSVRAEREDAGRGDVRRRGKQLVREIGESPEVPGV